MRGLRSGAQFASSLHDAVEQRNVFGASFSTSSRAGVAVDKAAKMATRGFVSAWVTILGHVWNVVRVCPNHVPLSCAWHSLSIGVRRPTRFVDATDETALCWRVFDPTIRARL